MRKLTFVLGIQSVRRRIQKKLKIKHQTVDLGLDKIERAEAANDERLKGRLSDSTVVSVSGPSNPFPKENGHDAIPRPEIKRQDTRDSTRSKASKKSKASSKKSRISFDEAAPRVSKADDTDSDDEEEEDDAHAFDHPSTYQDQPWIWIPKDVLGLSEILANDLRDGGVDASDVGAFMDEKGVVEVRRNPPDEEWTGGHDV